jgi:hypothetical protein
MDWKLRRRWLRAAIIAGLLYSAIGILFGLPTTHARAWRLAAWLASGVIYAAHSGHEYFRRASSPVATAIHVAVGVAIGGFGLAVAANIHELLISPAYRPSLALAFIAWPIVTALPALIVALVIAYSLALITRRSRPSASRAQS